MFDSSSISSITNSWVRSSTFKEDSKDTYHIKPTTASILAVTRTATGKTKPLIPSRQVLIGNQSDTIRSLCFSDHLNEAIQQRRAQVISLELWQDG
jgi:hypothetical protein